MFNVLKKYRKPDQQTEQPDDISQTKRWLFKGAATAGVALAAFGGWIGLRSDKENKINYQAAYDQDVLPGDKILQQNGFEEISKEETETIVQMFIDDYEHKKQA